MKKTVFVSLIAFVCFAAPVLAQIPIKTSIEIVKAEDELRYDKTLADLLKNADAKIRTRAALAAGRIGDEKAIPALTVLLENDSSAEVRAMAAFAIGEIESIKGADTILKSLKNTQTPDSVRARLTEAAGKIAAANAKDEKSKELGEAILEILEFEDRRGQQQNREVILFGITAALRAKPEKTDLVDKFLTNSDARIRAHAANTLARLRAKNANAAFRAMLSSERDAAARANAARALGAAEDKDSFNILLESAVADDDWRVRVSAIRALASIKDAKAATKLLERGEKLLADYKKSKFANPNEKSELLETATTLGRILQSAPTERAITFLGELREADRFQSAETEIALARVFTVEYPVATPDFKKMFSSAKASDFARNWRTLDSFVQGFGEAANIPENDNNKGWRDNCANVLRKFIAESIFLDAKIDEKTAAFVLPSALRGFANFKTDNLAQILRENLKHKDVFVRATAVELLGELPPEQIRFGDFEDSFRIALEDEKYDDALLATIGAIGKQKTERATDFLKHVLYPLSIWNPNYGVSKYLARRRVIALLKERNAGDFSDKIGKVDSVFTPADYARAVSRKNGTVRAVLATEKGNFTIDLTPEDAPLTVDNFIKLARRNYFNGLAVHRVVPNFVMQDGDPRGDGNGGPGWQIRCEINMLKYERGAVGMALSGKDTGGSQWFATHSPQPHLNGGYTVFGRVNETDMKIVDNLVRGDKILSVKIVEGKLQPKVTKQKPAR